MMKPSDRAAVPPEVVELLTLHRKSFYEAEKIASLTAHPVPSDTRAWSQILVTLLTGIKGLARKKGADLSDGSDVKAANLWNAIDTPRFNNCIKSGRKGAKGSIACLDEMPYLFFVMWDQEREHGRDRCRVWAVRPRADKVFRAICDSWYTQRDSGTIRSHNFQLHPPRNVNSDVFRNKCGNLKYPLLFSAEWIGDNYKVTVYDPQVLKTGTCRAVKS